MASVIIQETIISGSIDAQGVTSATTEVLSVVLVATDTLATTSAESAQTTDISYTTSTFISNIITPTPSIGASLEITTKVSSVSTAGPPSTAASSGGTTRSSSSTARGGSRTVTTGKSTPVRASASAPVAVRFSTPARASTLSSARTPTSLFASQGGSIDAVGGAGIGIACTILFLCLVGAIILYAQRWQRTRRDRMLQQRQLLDDGLNSEPQHDNTSAIWKDSYLAYYHDLSARPAEMRREDLRKFSNFRREKAVMREERAKRRKPIRSTKPSVPHAVWSI